MVRANDNAEKNNRETGKNTAESLSLTRQSNDATIRSVEATEQQYRTLASVLRAWLSLTRIDGWDFAQDKPGRRRVLVTFTNTGYSPALHIHAHGSMKLATDIEALAEDPETCADIHDPISTEAVGAGGTLKFEVLGLQLTTNDKAAMARGEVFVYIYGHVDYDDVFGMRRRSSYAAMYEIDGGHWSAAAKFNALT